ncbi:hypothetical protein V6N13_020113 [Hibiscus sabdariffa]
MADAATTRLETHELENDKGQASNIAHWWNKLTFPSFSTFSLTILPGNIDFLQQFKVVTTEAHLLEQAIDLLSAFIVKNRDIETNIIDFPTLDHDCCSAAFNSDPSPTRSNLSCGLLKNHHSLDLVPRFENIIEPPPEETLGIQKLQ